jgi:hypothetical protein
MRSLLYFDAMITPRIITFVYWLLLAGAVMAGGATMAGVGAWTFAGAASGLVVASAGGLAARVGCELLIVLFKINESMESVSHRL